MSDTTSDSSVIETTITTTSISVTTSPTTTIIVTEPTTTTTEPTTEPSTITSTTSEPPSTTIVEPATSTAPSVIDVTATTTLSPPPTEPATTAPTTPSVVVVTSTQEQSRSTATSDVTSTSSRESPSQTALSASGSGGGSGGLSSGGKIAIAVIIPIVVIAAAFLIGFFLWRKRKNRKNNEELRKNEMAEYGFNPNGDSSLAGGTTPYTDNISEGQDDSGGYRGWGATSSNRKPSTMGSNGRAAAGVAMSESSSQPGGFPHGSPNAASDHYSADPLMNGHPEGGDGVAALGAAGGLSRSRSGAAGVRRGPSNASSTYSEGHVSELSSDNHSVPGQYYQEEVPYNIYNDAAPSHGPYGDGSYGGTGGQPVIRDVQARRNTRIERAPTFPQNQGGISQNF